MPRRVVKFSPLAWIRLRYSALLGLQLLVFLVYPFLIDGPGGVAVMGLFITGTLVAASLALEAQASRRGMALTIPTVLGLWLAIATTSDQALRFACAVGIVCVSYQISKILWHVLQIERVSLEKVQGSLAVFFLLGLNWALIYTALELQRAGSFALGDPPQRIPLVTTPSDTHATHMLGFSHLLFHSYMTLCATTYGGVAALTPPALAMTALETLVGQIYLAVLVAQLMGLHLAFHATKS
jgi:hypothetical protein